MKLLVGAMIIASTLVACAGSPFKWEDARRVQSGMTTTEVTKILGQPYSMRSQEGVLRYVWVEVNPITFATKTLTIDFKEGIAVKAPQIPAEW